MAPGWVAEGPALATPLGGGSPHHYFMDPQVHTVQTQLLVCVWLLSGPGKATGHEQVSLSVEVRAVHVP